MKTSEVFGFLRFPIRPACLVASAQVGGHMGELRVGLEPLQIDRALTKEFMQVAHGMFGTVFLPCIFPSLELLFEFVA